MGSSLRLTAFALIVCVSVLACSKTRQEQAFSNPVKGSEADTTLLGNDGNGNGGRDDVDAYISSIETSSQKKAALTAFARESTQMMTLGSTPGTTSDVALNQQARVVGTIDCLASLYDRDDRRTLISTLGNALYNNAVRLRAYHTADGLLSGRILPAPSIGCDPALTPASP